jgi:hypothetical protein
MKKLLVILFSIGLTLGAAAQKRVIVGHGYVRPRVTVVAPIYPSPFYYGYGYAYSPFYNPWYDPFYGTNRYQARPSKLDLQIEDIQNDYQYQISTVRHDKSISRQDRKQKIRDLKHEKDEAIVNAKKNYYNKKSDESDSQS